ncbi:MAG: RnfH family protein [Gammaproteobacteria bacterium]|nr:RnfH family protein [Gammaproteobacteria bacterium]MBU1655822.1 RnfH family protein [Gammaproteobacteria bacterium]MBU1960216.1 RnfH family protein [Gammaproteobacteria bacterium]
MGTETMIDVEVAYAKADEQRVLRVHGEQGITLQEAVQKSGILGILSEIDWAAVDVGIYGKIMKKDAVLADGDRIEIYRPLIADPKEMRKKRAAEGKVMRRGGGDAEGAEGE